MMYSTMKCVVIDIKRDEFVYVLVRCKSGRVHQFYREISIDSIDTCYDAIDAQWYDSLSDVLGDYRLIKKLFTDNVRIAKLYQHKEVLCLL